jgi:hypothetical protein
VNDLASLKVPIKPDQLILWMTNLLVKESFGCVMNSVIFKREKTVKQAM